MVTRRLVLIALAAAIIAALAELTVRLLPGLVPPAAELRIHWRALTSTSPSIGDPELGFRYPPHYRGTLRHRDFGFSYLTDEHGFRNPSPWPPHADVVVLGDSQAFGYGVEVDASWWRLVADGLPDDRVINLGLIGAAPQQYARLFDAFGRNLGPRLVIVSLFPAYALTAVGQFDDWLAAGAPGNYDRWRFAANQPAWKRGLRQVLRSFDLWFAARAWWQTWRSGTPSRTIEFADGGRLRLAPMVYEGAAGHLAPDDPNFQRVLATIAGVRARAREHDGEVVVVLIPTKEEVHLPLLGLETAAFTDTVADALAAAGIAYVNSTPHFRARAERGERLFFPVDVHPNHEGQRLIAELILDHLRKDHQDLGAGLVGSPRSSGDQ